jgi:hypothetical protein
LVFSSLAIISHVYVCMCVCVCVWCSSCLGFSVLPFKVPQFLYIVFFPCFTLNLHFSVDCSYCPIFKSLSVFPTMLICWWTCKNNFSFQILCLYLFIAISFDSSL